MLIKIHPDNPNPREIKKVVDILKDGGLVIYPTDTIYGLGCDINNQKAVEKVCRIKGLDLKRDHLSFICRDLSHLSLYTKALSNDVFKTLKRNLPGPFTFLLPANNSVPRLFKNNKKTIGLRIPNNAIILEIVRELGNPVLSTSIKDEDEVIEYTTDPELIHEKYGNLVDAVIDGGFGGNIPSTIIDCTEHPMAIIREGAGIPEL